MKNAMIYNQNKNKIFALFNLLNVSLDTAISHILDPVVTKSFLKLLNLKIFHSQFRVYSVWAIPANSVSNIPPPYYQVSVSN